MRVDDRAADRKAHPDAFRLGREESFEDPFAVLRIEPDAGVANADEDRVR